MKSPGTYLGFIEKIPHLQRLGVNAVELLAGSRVLRRRLPAGARARPTTGATTRSDSSRPSRRTARGRTPGCQVDGVQDARARAARGRHQGHPRRRLQPHRRGQRARARACRFRGLDNPSYYSLTGPPDAPRRYYMNYTGCGNSLNFDSPAVIRLVMDSLRYWVEAMHVDGFRFDLASVLGPRGERIVSIHGAILRRGRAGSGAQSRDPDRRAVGHRHVSGRQLSGRLVGVERPLPRHRASLRQGRRRPAGRSGLAAHRIGRSVRRRRAVGVQQRQLHHLPRRLHAERSRLVQRQAQRDERREQPRRLQRQQLLELRRRRATRRIRACSRCAGS